MSLEMPFTTDFSYLADLSNTLQNRIGADIIMALDDVVKTTITGPRIEEAMYRTLRWIDRCIAGNMMKRLYISMWLFILLKFIINHIQSAKNNLYRIGLRPAVV